MDWRESFRVRESKCDDCDEDISEGETLCPECKERRYEAWRDHQDRLREERWEPVSLDYIDPLDC